MKKNILEKLEQARKHLLEAIKLYPDHPKDEWSRKELLSHLAGWDEDGVNGIPKILKGEKPISFKYSVNSYNIRSVEKRQDKGEPEIREELDKLHRQFIKIVNSLDEGQIAGYFGTFLRKRPINILWLINEKISHDNNHAREIEEKYKNRYE